MTALLLGALAVHLASCALLAGTFFMLLLAGHPGVPAARRWDARMIGGARAVAAVAIGSGIAWLLLRTAAFENRPHAAIELRAVAHAVLDTWPGLVWLARHGVLLVLAVFLALRAEVVERRNWVAARGEGLLLAALALALVSASSHAAATGSGAAVAVAIDVAHLLATGLWAGALVPLALLLRTAGADSASGSREFAVRAARRFSGAGLAAMLVLLASGALSAVVHVGSVGGLLGTRHGHLLLFKLAMLAPILALAAVNRTRILPAMSEGEDRSMRRLAAFVSVEALCALAVIALAAAMTLTTPGRHADSVWPLPFRLTADGALGGQLATGRAVLGLVFGLAGLAALARSLGGRRRAAWIAGGFALLLVGAGAELPSFAVDAYPTTYLRPSVPYQAASIVAGMATYRAYCAACHGAAEAAGGPARASDLRRAPAARRSAGELFWIVSHGAAAGGMPAFAGRLSEAERWNAINFIRASAAADGARAIGPEVAPDVAWLAAPDFSIAVGPLAPGALRDHRGRRMVLLVLYSLPESRARLAELARSSSVLSVLGVEIVAVSQLPSPDAIAELGASPPILFPVVTDGSADIAGAYRLFAPGAHAELLIDRQGYIRAIWREDGGMPRAADVQAQVEKLNEEKSPPPFPDDHVH